MEDGPRDRLDSGPPHYCFGRDKVDAAIAAHFTPVRRDLMRIPQPIRMDRTNLACLPPRQALPPGLSVHTYSDRLHEPWMDLLEACSPESGKPPRERWRERVVSDPRFMCDGWFLMRDATADRYCATARAWAEGPDQTGLGRLVMGLLLHHMADVGFERVTLDTEAFRIAAVGLYLSLGFVPMPRNREERAIRAEVVAQASHRRTSYA